MKKVSKPKKEEEVKGHTFKREGKTGTQYGRTIERRTDVDPAGNSARLKEIAELLRGTEPFPLSGLKKDARAIATLAGLARNLTYRVKRTGAR